MTKSDLRKKLISVGHHAGILSKGFVRMLWGATLMIMIVAGVYGFTVIPSEDGYAAVGDFLFSITSLSIAIVGIYLMGRNSGKGSKK